MIPATTKLKVYFCSQKFLVLETSILPSPSSRLHPTRTSGIPLQPVSHPIVNTLKIAPPSEHEKPGKFVSSTNAVTAACLYPALRLDKLYAALIRCLVLWTVTKQILVFVF